LHSNAGKREIHNLMVVTVSVGTPTVTPSVVQDRSGASCIPTRSATAIKLWQNCSPDVAAWRRNPGC